MVTTTAYFVKAGDWLTRIAEEHGSTVSVIWNHPDNAEHRAKRGSPDVLYPGDVLHIPVAAKGAPPVGPSLRLVNFLEHDGGTGGGASGGAGKRGAVVPDVGNLLLMVSLDGATGPLNPADVSVRQRPNVVAGMTDAQANQLLKPLDPPGGVTWPDPNDTKQYLVFAFLDVPKGTFSALVVIENVVKGSSLQAGGSPVARSAAPRSR